MTGSDVTCLLDLMDEAFDRPGAWHGPNLRSALQGVDAGAAAAHPARGRHSIHELVLHCAYWKHRVRARLDPDGAGRFPRRGRNFPAPERPGSEAVWRADLELLAETHRDLRDVAARLASSELDRAARGHRQTPRRLVMGIAAHDLYHAGQIGLLRKMTTHRKGGR